VSAPAELSIDTRLESGRTFRLPVLHVNQLTVDWGDGVVEVVNPPAGIEGENSITAAPFYFIPHTYARDGIYTVKFSTPDNRFIRYGRTGRVGFTPFQTMFFGIVTPDDLLSSRMLTRVLTWGDQRTTTINFLNASNLTSVPNFFPLPPIEEVPGTPGIASWMFAGCSSFTSNVSNFPMQRFFLALGMFSGATSFARDISSWIPTGVINFSSMFSGATNFNSNISLWPFRQDVTLNMDAMFRNATSFNQNLSTWCVGNNFSQPFRFDEGATSWTLPRPEWGTCPSGFEAITEFPDAEFFTAKLFGEIKPLSTFPIIERGFKFGTNPNPQTKIQIGSGLGKFETTVSSLSPGTTYYVRSYAVNSNQLELDGDIIEFETLSAEPVSFIEVTMPTVDEDNVSIGTATFEDPMDTGVYFWDLPETEITVDGIVAGQISLAASATATPELTFTPTPNWFGTATFTVRVNNSFVLSDAFEATVTINPVPDPPSAVVGELPTLDEDSTAEFDLTWTDVDDLPAGTLKATDGYSIEVRTSPGRPFRTLTSFAPAAALTDFTVRLISYSNTELRATLRVEPVANYNGAYSMQVRVRDEVDGVVLFGPTRTLTGTIVSVPDAPTRPQPSRMTTARATQTVQTTFRTFDPDLEDTSWLFEISKKGENNWLNGFVISDVGTLTVIDTDLSDQQADVRLVQQEGGATELRYEFDLRVTDSSGLISPTQTVVGFITPPNATVFLQKVSRSSPLDIEPITPLREVIELNIIDSIDGVGGANVVVATDELRRRAAQASLDIRDLLDPGTVELVVAIGTEIVFTGPIGDVEWSATGQTVDISARGLLAYLEDRRIGSSTKSFVNEDISDIVATFVSDTQGQSFGDLGIVDQTSPAGTNLTVEFKSGDRVLRSIRELSQADGGPEVWITPERELQSAPARGSDKRSIVFITAGMMTAATWKTRDELVATVVTVIGGSDGNDGFFEGTAITSDTAALARYGRRERVLDRPALTSNQECEDYARRQVEQQSRRLEDLRLQTIITPDRPFSIRDVEIGDIVTVDLRAPDLGQIVGAYRITNRELRLVSETADSYRLSLDLVNAPIDDGELVKLRARQNASIFERIAQQE